MTEFFVDYNQSFEGGPPNPLVPGRYLVSASTPHINGGRRAVGQFIVE